MDSLPCTTLLALLIIIASGALHDVGAASYAVDSQPDFAGEIRRRGEQHEARVKANNRMHEAAMLLTLVTLRWQKNLPKLLIMPQNYSKKRLRSAVMTCFDRIIIIMPLLPTATNSFFATEKGNL